MKNKNKRTRKVLENRLSREKCRTIVEKFDCDSLKKLGERAILNKTRLETVKTVANLGKRECIMDQRKTVLLLSLIHIYSGAGENMSVPL